jgi:hypothetical protein
MPRTIKGSDGGKRYPLNMRTTREMRERLEASARASGRSLAQEVEIRLEQSFRVDDVRREIKEFAAREADYQKRINQLTDLLLQITTKDLILVRKGAEK